MSKECICGFQLEQFPDLEDLLVHGKPLVVKEKSKF